MSQISRLDLRHGHDVTLPSEMEQNIHELPVLQTSEILLSEENSIHGQLKLQPVLLGGKYHLVVTSKQHLQPLDVNHTILDMQPLSSVLVLDGQVLAIIHFQKNLIFHSQDTKIHDSLQTISVDEQQRTSQRVLSMRMIHL